MGYPQTGRPVTQRGGVRGLPPLLGAGSIFSRGARRVPRVISPCFGDGQSEGGSEYVSDGLEGADRPPAAGFDYGSDVGVLFCAPLGAESVGDFAEGGAGAQAAFGFVVGRGTARLDMKTRRLGRSFSIVLFHLTPAG